MILHSKYFSSSVCQFDGFIVSSNKWQWFSPNAKLNAVFWVALTCVADGADGTLGARHRRCWMLLLLLIRYSIQCFSLGWKPLYLWHMIHFVKYNICLCARLCCSIPTWSRLLARSHSLPYSSITSIILYTACIYILRKHYLNRLQHTQCGFRSGSMYFYWYVHVHWT